MICVCIFVYSKGMMIYLYSLNNETKGNFRAGITIKYIQFYFILFCSILIYCICLALSAVFTFVDVFME